MKRHSLRINQDQSRGKSSFRVSTRTEGNPEVREAAKQERDNV